MTKTAMKKYGIDDKIAEQIDAIATELGKRSAGGATKIAASVSKSQKGNICFVEFIIYFAPEINADFGANVCLAAGDIAEQIGASFGADATSSDTEEAEAYERDAFVVWKR
jgi:hypothetical protein